MPRRLIVWIVMIVASGCSLSAKAPPTPTAPPSPTAAPTEIALAEATATPTTAATPRPTASPVGQRAGGSNCQTPSGWYAHTVQRGDTLGRLARQANTDISTLTEANCLTNPDHIRVGQTVYLPGTDGAGEEPGPGAAACPEIGEGDAARGLRIDKYRSLQGACYTLTPGEDVMVSWPMAPQNFAEVTFYRRSESMTRTDVIGVDTNPQDGASVSWRVPPMQPSVMWAMAVVPQGAMVNSSEIGAVGEG